MSAISHVSCLDGRGAAAVSAGPPSVILGWGPLRLYCGPSRALRLFLRVLGLNWSGVDPPLSSSRACLTTFIAISVP